MSVHILYDMEMYIGITTAIMKPNRVYIVIVDDIF